MDAKAIGSAAVVFAHASVMRVLLVQIAANTTNPMGWLAQTLKLVEDEIKNGSPPPTMPDSEAQLLIDMALQRARTMFDIHEIKRAGLDPGADTRK